MAGAALKSGRRGAVLPALLLVLLPALLLGGCTGLVRWQGGGGPPSRSHHQAAPSAGYTVVEPGDTLYSIAFRNNLDYHDLARWNGIGSDYTIYAGQRLRLTPPPGGTARPAGSSPGVSTTPSPSPPPPSPPITVTGGSPPPAATAEGNAQGWRWPTDGSVVRGFDPDHGSKGIDITGSLGQSVVAAAAGKVVYSGSALKGYGKLIIIKHHGDYLSAYGYNRELLVHEGDYVKAGDPIATMGEGPSRRTELHFEIRYKGRPVDPLGLLPRR